MYLNAIAWLSIYQFIILVSTFYLNYQLWYLYLRPQPLSINLSIYPSTYQSILDIFYQKSGKNITFNANNGLKPLTINLSIYKSIYPSTFYMYLLSFFLYLSSKGRPTTWTSIPSMAINPWLSAQTSWYASRPTSPSRGTP